ncbi:MAG TPA: glycosyltransferase, partial [Chitinophagaceae bacterium]|nr:glycosyltransferase [Chitinophagaceae bacterium]
AFREGVNNLALKYDVLFIDHYEMYQYVPLDYQGKTVLHQHNCEYLLWERFGKLDPNPLKKAVLYNQAWHIRRYEKKITRKVDTILAAPNDKEELIKIGAPSGKFFETYHLGDTEWLDAPALEFDKAENALFFVGTLTWEANVDGLLWMLENVWPELLKRQPGLQFYIVGKNPDARLIDMVAGLRDVHLEGFKDDLDEYYRRAKIFVAPLRFGSGTKVKVMNALYRGIPAITTKIGIEGIMAEHRKHIWLAETPEEWVDGVVTLLNDKTVWQTLSNNSRQLSAEKYTWDAVMENVRKAIG